MAMRSMRTYCASSCSASLWAVQVGVHSQTLDGGISNSLDSALETSN